MANRAWWRLASAVVRLQQRQPVAPLAGRMAFAAPAPTVVPRRGMAAVAPSGTPGPVRRSPITWGSLAVTLVAGAGLVYYFQLERERKNQRVAVQETIAVGKPKLGGPFNLVDQNGQPFTEANLQGRWSLLYFGFTHCPDICPEELEKMITIVDGLEKRGVTTPVVPIFITVDPKRDTVAQVRAYVKEFSPKLIGLTGTPQQVAQAARAYRVYFSVNPGNPNDPDSDYLVDHSIFFYLMDPSGGFADYYGQNKSAEECMDSIAEHIRTYRPPAPAA